MNRRRLLRNIAIGIFVIAAVFLGITGLAEGNLVTIVWISIVIPGALDWWNEQRDKPFQAWPDSLIWRISKLLYVIALGIGGGAIAILENRMFARIGGVLLVLAALGYVAAFFSFKKTKSQTL